MSIKLTILALVLLVNVNPALSQLKKVRFSVAAPSIAEMPFRIAQTKGFYREEGLDVEVIFIRGAVGMQALLGGSVDFTSASGSTIAAAVRGIPVKLVFTASAKPQFDMVALKEIRSIADLKGKYIGISSRGGAIDLLTQLMVQKHGLVPNKDVTSLVIGGQEDTVLALRTGRIAAALLTPPRPLMLAREGFNRIGYSGDYMPTYPSGGIGVTDDTIKNKPSELYAFVKGQRPRFAVRAPKPRRGQEDSYRLLRHQRLCPRRSVFRVVLKPIAGERLGRRGLDEGSHRIYPEELGRRRQGSRAASGFRF